MDSRSQARLKKMVRVLICGGRDYASYGKFCFGMTEARKYIAPDEIDIVIHGACPSGADRMAELWAKAEGLTIKRFPAAWNIHGRGAGPIRNQQMIDEGKPDYVFAFKGGDGTRDMATKAMVAGVPVIFPDNIRFSSTSRPEGPALP